MQNTQNGLKVKRNAFGFSSAAAPVGRGMQVSFESLEKVERADKVKTLPPALHDFSLIQDVA